MVVGINDKGREPFYDSRPCVVALIAFLAARIPVLLIAISNRGMDADARNCAMSIFQHVAHTAEIFLVSLTTILICHGVCFVWFELTDSSI